MDELPSIKKGILHPGILFQDMVFSGPRARQLNIMYAKDYSIWSDLEITAGNFKKLDSTDNG